MRPARIAALVLGVLGLPGALHAQATTPATPAPTSEPPTEAPASSTATPTSPAADPSAPAPSTQPADAAAPTTPPPPAAPVEPPLGVWRAPLGEAPPLPYPVVLSAGSGLAPRLSVGDFMLEPHARIRLRGAWVQADPNIYFVGQNSGFNLALARAGLTGSFRRSVRFSLSVEGAADRRDRQNQLVGELSTRLRDAFLTFAPWDFLQLTAGQFRPPSDRESLSSIDAATGSGPRASAQLLPEVSVGNRGVQAGEGLQTRGLDPGRDIGVMLHGDVKGGPFFTATWAMALVNGNGENQVLNDNAEPVAWGRWTAGVHGLPVLNLLDVGLSLHYGRNTNISALPSVFHDQVVGSTLDGVIRIFGFEVWAQGTWQQTRHFTTQAPTELAVASFLQVAYRDLFGFSPVVRAAFFQPSSALPQYTVAELTGGMRFDMPNLPLSIFLSYTHPEETGWGIYDLGADDATPSDANAANIPRAPAALRTPLGIRNWGVDQREGFPIANERLEGAIQLSF
ncbi:MAG: hypothetical protein AB2A00_20045 [Myxococcota bacterium]